MKRRHGALGLVGILFAAGCAAAGGSSNGSLPDGSSAGPTMRLVRSDQPRMVAGDPAAAGAGMAGFGAALLGQLPADGNLVISPYSIYAALAMTRAGAPEPVATELDKILGAADAAAVVTAVDAALAETQQGATEEQPAPTISPANSLWVQDGTINPDFLDRVAAGFDAGVYLTDYRNDPEASRAAINGWVSEHTEALIPELIPAGAIGRDTVLALVNALYFAAEWGVPITESDAPLSFSTAAGDVVNAPAFAVTTELLTANGTGWRSVTIPYVGRAVAMTLIVPDTGSFSDVQQRLDGGLIAAALAGTSTPLELTVPKFAIDTSTSLQSVLTALGAPSMFSKREWPELMTDQELLVSDVVHQAVIETDEKGTVAAAATAVLVIATSAMATVSEFTVDRPFFFVIHDTTTNAPLFLGRVLDPTVTP